MMLCYKPEERQDEYEKDLLSIMLKKKNRKRQTTMRRGNRRRKERKGEQRVKAVEKSQRDTDGEHSGFSDDEEFVASGKSGPTDEEKLKQSLFGDDEGPPLEDIAEEEEQPEEEEEDIGDEDDMADFIVNEEVDEHGAPMRRGKLNKKKPE